MIHRLAQPINHRMFAEPTLVNFIQCLAPPLQAYLPDARFADCFAGARHLSIKCVKREYSLAVGGRKKQHGQIAVMIVLANFARAIR